ncbi:MAG: CheR family methyltransferase [Gemmataceae bacterium]
MPIGVFLILREIIRDRIGISFDDEKRELLASKLSDRVHARGLHSFLDYYYLLKYGADRDQEWPHLTNALSVQETYFWREIDQIRVLVDVLLPQVIAANQGPIRIWSAACATGEEPYTIAIALAEAGYFDRADISIWASDISTLAIERARAGKFRERSLRALPAALRAKYFNLQGDDWILASKLQNHVQFVRANLLEPSELTMLAMARFIFCRNVFIYFSAPTISRVIGALSERMPHPGYLFVGASESLMRIKSDFVLQEVDGAFVYLRS